MKRVLVVWIAACAVFAGTLVAEARPDPDRVLILANEAIPESVELAEYYAHERHIPERNIIRLPLQEGETFSWANYVAQLHNPLRKWLHDNGWLNDGDAEADPQGRLRGRVLGHRIEYLVLCKGVPLKIANEASLDSAESRQIVARYMGFRDGKLPDDQPNLDRLLTAQASVDSELAALPAPTNPVLGFIPNPVYHQEKPFASDLVGLIKVARLDGPTFADARQMIDGALEAERLGLRGRVYVDKGGPYPLANEWLEDVATAFRDAGWDTMVDEQKATFAATDRFDAPAVYFGWYTQYVDGPFKQPGFRFPPGAVAVHLHSYSASTLGNERNWTPGLIARGAAATVGNVYEPTLGMTHDFETIAKRLLDGWTWGDAAWCAMPVLSWQGVVLGDPLYQPMRLGLKAQLDALDAPKNQLLGQYVVLRRMQELRAEGKADEALVYGRRRFMEQPGYALALELARMQADDPDAAVSQLAFIKSMGAATPAEAGIALDAARFLAGIDRPADALALLDAMMLTPVSPEFAAATRALALEIASKTGDIRALENWRNR